jgi:hypothetical protein
MDHNRKESDEILEAMACPACIQLQDNYSTSDSTILQFPASKPIFGETHAQIVILLTIFLGWRISGKTGQEAMSISHKGLVEPCAFGMVNSTNFAEKKV